MAYFPRCCRVLLGDLVGSAFVRDRVARSQRAYYGTHSFLYYLSRRSHHREQTDLDVGRVMGTILPIFFVSPAHRIVAATPDRDAFAQGISQCLIIVTVANKETWPRSYEDCMSPLQVDLEPGRQRFERNTSDPQAPRMSIQVTQETVITVDEKLATTVDEKPATSRHPQTFTTSFKFEEDTARVRTDSCSESPVSADLCTQ